MDSDEARMVNYGLSRPSPPSVHRSQSDVVVVTSAAVLASLVDTAVSRSVQRALSAVLAERERDADWLTVRDAVRAYGRSRTTLDRWRRAGLIRSKRIGGTRYYERPANSARGDEAFPPPPRC